MNNKPFAIAIAGSAGALNPIIKLLNELPTPLHAVVVVAIHSNEDSNLTEILQSKTEHKVETAEDGLKIESGIVYVAPGAKHVLFKNGYFRVSQLVKNSGFRPSIDALFISLATEYLEQAIAVVLSGTMQDGVRGAQVIFDMGGQTIVQEPSEAKFSEMPYRTILADHPQQVLPASELGKWLSKQVSNHG